MSFSTANPPLSGAMRDCAVVRSSKCSITEGVVCPLHEAYSAGSARCGCGT